MRFKNEQEVFDHIWNYFLDPNHDRGVNEMGDCVYRAPDGSKCAFGCLLEDGDYDSLMEGRSASEIVEAFDLDSTCFSPEVSWEFLDEMQTAHDSNLNKETMYSSFIHVAKQWNLSVYSNPFEGAGQ